MDYATTLQLAGEFIAKLDDITNGERAALRRSMDQPLAQATSALPVFFRTVPPEVTAWRERGIFFRVATYYAYAQAQNPLNWPAGPNLGGSLRLARTGANAAGLDKRVAALLAASGVEFTDRCRHLVVYLTQQRVRINYARLIADLLFINGLTRALWANAYYGRATPSTPSPIEEE